MDTKVVLCDRPLHTVYLTKVDIRCVSRVRRPSDNLEMQESFSRCPARGVKGSLFPTSSSAAYAPMGENTASVPSPAPLSSMSHVWIKTRLPEASVAHTIFPSCIGVCVSGDECIFRYSAFWMSLRARLGVTCPSSPSRRVRGSSIRPSLDSGSSMTRHSAGTQRRPAPRTC